MRIIQQVDEITETARGWLSGGTVGFVPTMGRLHEGSLLLVRTAHQECEISVVSIFANPKQLGWDEDLGPVCLDEDLELLKATGVDVVFIPREEDIYPPYFSTYVIPSGPLAERLEGASSPGHFRGIATSITKLLMLIRPDRVYFGQKDAQQVAIIRKLVRDFNIDVSLRVLATVRNSNGLPLSSRNSRLSPTEQRAALVLYHSLLAGKALVDQQEYRSEVIEGAIVEFVSAEPLISLEYVAICEPETFQDLPEVRPGTLLTIAAHVGTTRLVDNIFLREDGTWQI